MRQSEKSLRSTGRGLAAGALAGAAALLIASLAPRAGGSLARAEEGAAPSPRPEAIATLRTLVAETIASERELAAEERGWIEAREHLEATRAVLEREAALLGDEVAALERESASLAEEVARQKERTLAAHRHTERADAAARSGAERLLAELDRLPPPARAGRLEGAARLRATLEPGAGAAPADPSERFRLVVSLARDLARAHSRAWSGQTTIELGDGEREVDALWLGSALGWYVSPDGEKSGWLLPSPAGWKPAPLPENSASLVRRAIDVARRRRSPEIVELPVPAGGGER